ncbi:MAG: phosphopantetheine-binding protein, partial [Coleofasciculaceae cyanobacterium]
AEMLEMDMDMEADLGIDSIKRVEILGALQEQYPQLPKPNLEELAEIEMRTLGDVVDFTRNLVAGAGSVPSIPSLPSPTAPAASLEAVVDKTPELPEAAPVAPVAPVATLPSPEPVASNGSSPVIQESSSIAVAEPAAPVAIEIDFDQLCETLLVVVSDKTGYPAEMLEMDMDMEADLGIDSIKRVEILGALQEQYPQLPKPNLEELAEIEMRTLGDVVDFTRNLVAGAGSVQEEKKKELQPA